MKVRLPRIVRVALRGGTMALVATVLVMRTAAAAEPRSVLLIYADAHLAAPAAALDRSLRDAVGADATPPVRFHTEYVDGAWVQHGADIRQAIRTRYAGRAFDLVIPCGESALRFALDERDTLFPNVPMVFFGVEEGALRDLRIPEGVTGVTMFRDWTAGLDLVMRLHPKTQRAAFVGGASAVERRWEALARAAFARYDGRLTITYLTGLTIEDTVAAVAKLPPDSAIVFNTLFRDGAGRAFSSAEALERIVPASPVPIYGFLDSQLGHGIVGGPLVSLQVQVQQAGQLAARILGGERLGQADIIHRVPVHHTFDARQLARWGVSERLLPPNSVVQFRPPTFWQEHRVFISTVLVLIAGHALLIFGLVFGHRRQRTVQRSLDNRRRFDVLLADLAAGFVKMPADEMDQRITEGLRRTLVELDLDRAGFAELAPVGTEMRVTHAVARDGLSAPAQVFTAEAWPWSLARLRRGEEVRVDRLADLPEEAGRDRESFSAVGTQAALVLPLMVGGSVLGGLACSMQHERVWTEDLVRELRPLADLFAIVLMRRRSDRALEASENRFHQLADAAPVMMWVAGPDGRAIDFNRSWLDFRGRTLAQESGDGWLDGVHPDDRAACLKTYRAAIDGRTAFSMEYRLRRGDGVYRSVLDNGLPSFDAARTFQGLVGCTVDVTEVKRAQQTLVDSLALRSEIFGSLYGQLAAVDREGVIVAVNEGWTVFLDQKGGDARTAGVGVNYFEVCRKAAASGDPYAQAATDAIEGVLHGRSLRALIEYPCATSAGTQWYAMVVEPFKRPEGGLVISHINITRRRLAEEEVQREREELAHALRVATLGGLATSLAHEINQPLAAIASNAQAANRLLDDAPVDPDVPAALRDIADAAQRAAEIIRRLRVLFRKEQGDPRPVDLEEVIKEVISLLHKELEYRRVRVQLSVTPGLPRVLGDMVQLQQVILNVCINAAEAMAGSAHPRQLTVTAAAREPAIIAITIADTGPGVPAAEIEHIFERFVTSKPDGLGMGLSISSSIVTAHGGRMWAARNPGRGLTIHIELPSLEG